VRSAEFGVRSAEFGVRSAEFGVRSAELGNLLVTRKYFPITLYLDSQSSAIPKHSVPDDIRESAIPESEVLIPTVSVELPRAALNHQ